MVREVSSGLPFMVALVDGWGDLRSAVLEAAGRTDSLPGRSPVFAFGCEFIPRSDSSPADPKTTVEPMCESNRPDTGNGRKESDSGEDVSS